MSQISEKERDSKRPGPKRKNRLLDELQSLQKLPNFRMRFWACIAHPLPRFTLPRLRTQMYRLSGCQIDKSVAILGPLKLIGFGRCASRLSIGPGCTIAPDITFGLDETIRLGKKVSISPGAILYTGTHGIGFGSCRMSPRVTAKPIVVEDGVWIGMNCLVLPGVTLGQGCVISSGAVVSKDVPANVLVAGNPAEIVEKLPFGNR